MHFGIVLAGHTQHIHDVPDRGGIPTSPSVHHGGNLHPALRTQAGAFFGIHLYVVGHILALHHHPGLCAHGVVDAHELLAAALHYLYHFALAFADGLLSGPRGRLGTALLGHSDLYDIAVQGVAGLGRLHEDVVILPVNNHKDEPLAGHLHASLIHGHALSHLAGTAPATAGTTPAFILSFCHNIQSYYKNLAFLLIFVVTNNLFLR